MHKHNFILKFQGLLDSLGIHHRIPYGMISNSLFSSHTSRFSQVCTNLIKDRLQKFKYKLF